MNKFLLYLILTVLLGVSISAQKMRNEKFVGVFQLCDVHCSTYYINPDFTFKHRFSGQETFGAWKYDGKNKIKLFAPGKKAETIKMTGKNNNDEKIEVELKIPKVRAFKKTFFFKNDSICTLYNKGKSKSCYQRIETEQQNN